MLKIFNTLTRRPEEFIPLAPPDVKMYTCGPTVYNHATIGNFRAYVFEDILRRYLKVCGFKVRQAMNLTDVDDKTIRGARAAGVSLADYTKPYKDAFFADMQTLNIEPAEHYPEATGHIPEMIALIQTLIDKRYAYPAADGSVYFSIARFKKYGQLAHLDMQGLKPGARIAQDEYEKENASDFALWKAYQEEDGDVAWDSPWGRGRPGWHIECSAMSMKYLGESFDLHTGGIDNIFPHHEDEIAQSEAATGKPFVKYWMHCAHLVVDGRKMSKSLGNFYTLRDLTQKGFSGREIRYVLLSAHYRQSLNFTFPALEAARSSLHRLDEFNARLQDAAGKTGTSPGGNPAWIENYFRKFRAAMDEDLNLPAALAALFDMIHEGNRKMNAEALSAAEAQAALNALDGMDAVLGVLKRGMDKPDRAIMELARSRQNARKAKDWAEADRLRREIETKGWIIQDAADGFKLKKRSQ
ncbi:MAG: cysteine--tRNA ligase [Kiritimatiellae bacterium]|nr:cysteine--tRNA ligase [Kiritimatiellia bacterium]